LFPLLLCFASLPGSPCFLKQLPPLVFTVILMNNWMGSETYVVIFSCNSITRPGNDYFPIVQMKQLRYGECVVCLGHKLNEWTCVLCAFPKGVTASDFVPRSPLLQYIFYTFWYNQPSCIYESSLNSKIWRKIYVISTVSCSPLKSILNLFSWNPNK
jgi:hypothetical protein